MHLLCLFDVPSYAVTDGLNVLSADNIAWSLKINADQKSDFRRYAVEVYASAIG